MRNAFLFTVGFVFSVSVLAQQQPEVKKEIITYDPAFWRNELRLDVNQYIRIQEINSNFYKNLMEASVINKNDNQRVQATLERNLENRSKQIWETLYPRQRRKLERIMREI